MKPEIYYKKGGIHVDKNLHAEWVIKAPTRRNRLDRSGSAGLKMDEKYDLKHTKKGILFIDHTQKAYVKMPKELLEEPVGKDCNGLKNSIFSYNVNEIVNKHNLTIVSIPHEDSLEETYETGLAGEIRKRFGL